MANAARGEVEVSIGGRNYTAKFDYEAIVCLETHFGTPKEPKPISEIMPQGKTVPATMIAVLLWAMLRANHADEFPAIEAVVKRLEVSKLAYYSERVKAVFELSELSKKDQQARPTSAPVNGAGADVAAIGSIGPISNEQRQS